MKGAVARNNHMANAINKYLTNGTCSKAIMIVGKKHLFEDVSIPHYRSIPSLLNKNINTTTIEILGTMFPVTSAPPYCKESPIVGFGAMETENNGFIIAPDEKVMTR